MRSGIEISNTLRAICSAGETLFASLPPDDILFLSTLLHVDAEAGSMVIAWSTSKDANLAVLAARRVVLGCSHEGAHCEFPATDPHETDHDGRPGIRFAFPDSLLVLRRRASRRYVVPPQVPLICEISLGAIAFEAKVVDISLNGIGAITYDASNRLVAGMMLRRARIIQPRGRPVIVDLEVRHISRIVLPEGRPAHRAGCRFIGDAREIEGLIRLFVTELDA